MMIPDGSPLAFRRLTNTVCKIDMEKLARQDSLVQYAKVDFQSYIPQAGGIQTPDHVHAGGLQSTRPGGCPAKALEAIFG